MKEWLTSLLRAALKAVPRGLIIIIFFSLTLVTVQKPCWPITGRVPRPFETNLAVGHAAFTFTGAEMAVPRGFISIVSPTFFFVCVFSYCHIRIIETHVHLKLITLATRVYFHRSRDGCCSCSHYNFLHIRHSSETLAEYHRKIGRLSVTSPSETNLSSIPSRLLSQELRLEWSLLLAWFTLQKPCRSITVRLEDYQKHLHLKLTSSFPSCLLSQERRWALFLSLPVIILELFDQAAMTGRICPPENSPLTPLK